MYVTNFIRIQLLPSLIFSLLPRPFGTRQAAFAGILAGGAVLGFFTISGMTLAQLFPAAPVLVKSLNIGLLALATNALVFTGVTLLGRRAAARDVAGLPA